MHQKNIVEAQRSMMVEDGNSVDLHCDFHLACGPGEMQLAVMVTGGAGYIGSHMAHALVDRGEETVVVDDLSTGRRRSVPEAATFFNCDVGDGEAITDLMMRRRV